MPIKEDEKRKKESKRISDQSNPSDLRPSGLTSKTEQENA